MLGRNFTEKASKLKIDAAIKKRDKMFKRIKKYQEAEAKMNKALQFLNTSVGCIYYELFVE